MIRTSTNMSLTPRFPPYPKDHPTFNQGAILVKGREIGVVLPKDCEEISTRMWVAPGGDGKHK